MIITCTNCASRLQIDAAKVPSGSFSVKCPKCNTTVSSAVASPASQKSALSVGGSPSTDHPRVDRAKPAPQFASNDVPQVTDSGTPATSELARALVDLLDQSRTVPEIGRRDRPSWNRRQVLVCSAEVRRENIARQLAENHYDVYLAEDARQAMERMRETKLDVVLLDPEFDAAEQGAAFVTREVNILRPAQRRRLFFGLLSPSLRTLDSHAAFLNNANLTININDLEELSETLDRAIREYNELYSDFFHALNVPAL